MRGDATFEALLFRLAWGAWAGGTLIAIGLILYGLTQ